MIYETVEDLKGLSTSGATEGLHLEFKRSDLITKKKVSDITKEICAFANSDGGIILFGVKEGDDGAADGLDDGVSPTARTPEWLDQIIRSNIQPELSGYKITEIRGDQSCFYVMSVSKSRQAPHQAQDKRYYKRYGSHSQPMEDYELSDVRSRVFTDESPLQISLKPRGHILYLRIENISRRDICDLRPRISSNIVQKEYLKPFTSRGLRRLKGFSHAEFLIGSFFEIFRDTENPTLIFEYEFTIDGKNYDGREEFIISDFQGQSADPDPQIKALEEIAKNLSEIRKGQKEIIQFARQLSSAVNSTGVKLSYGTLQSLRGKRAQHRFSPYGMDPNAFSEILDIDADMGMTLYRIFGYIGSQRGYQQELSKLPPELVEKLKQKFELDPDSDPD